MGEHAKAEQPGPIDGSFVHMGNGHYLLNSRCERCKLVYTTTMDVRHSYRPLCPPCAEETGEAVELPRRAVPHD